MTKQKYLFLKNIALSSLRKPADPYKLTFIITYKCNLQCKTCSIWQKPPKEELGLGHIERIFKQIKNLSWLDLGGGEVTLRNDALEAVEIILKSSPSLLIFHMATNGQQPERVFSIAQTVLRHNRIPVINISINGPEDIHDYITGKSGSWQMSGETFRLLKTLKKGYYYISYTISKYNIKSIAEAITQIKDACPEFNPADLHFNFFHKSAHFYANEGMEDMQMDVLKTVLPFLKISQKGNLIKYFLERYYIKGLLKFAQNRHLLRCQALNTSCFIDAYGDVYPCSLYGRLLGNLKNVDYNLGKILEDKNTVSVRSDIDKGACPGCWSPCEVYPAILGSAVSKLFFKTV
jgi:Fe-coproporphyrin III synthase